VRPVCRRYCTGSYCVLAAVTLSACPVACAFSQPQYSYLTPVGSVHGGCTSHDGATVPECGKDGKAISVQRDCESQSSSREGRDMRQNDGQERRSHRDRGRFSLALSWDYDRHARPRCVETYVSHSLSSCCACLLFFLAALRSHDTQSRKNRAPSSALM